jgi:hypothetical protein
LAVEAIEVALFAVFGKKIYPEGKAKPPGRERSIDDGAIHIPFFGGIFNLI